jgi:RNA polymerase sigma-70 factor (ECF subfamily)
MNELESKFAQTIKQNKSTIYTVCYMFSKDADEVNDLFQEAVINLWRGFEGFENRSNVKTWIYRVALNTCISQERKKRRTSTEPLSMNINLFEDHDEDTRQVDMLHKRISRLQPFDRAIVLLWLENMPYEEIGQVVGISTTAVATRLFRIKEQLTIRQYHFRTDNHAYSIDILKRSLQIDVHFHVAAQRQKCLHVGIAEMSPRLIVRIFHHRGKC